MKQKSGESFKKGVLHKYHSNIPSVENTKSLTSNEVTYAKEVFQNNINEIMIIRPALKQNN